MTRAGALRRALRAGPAGWADLVTLTWLAIVAEVGIRRRPLPAVARRFGCPLDDEPTGEDAFRPMDAIERRRHSIVEGLMRHWPFGDRDGLCLRRALLLGWILKHRRPVLRIGVARTGEGEDKRLSAHAWIELEGRTLGADMVHRAFRIGPDKRRDQPA